LNPIAFQRPMLNAIRQCEAHQLHLLISSRG
jgi:hypothetical protein